MAISFCAFRSRCESILGLEYLFFVENCSHWANLSGDNSECQTVASRQKSQASMIGLPRPMGSWLHALDVKAHSDVRIRFVNHIAP
jgi:hypothetical protein